MDRSPSIKTTRNSKIDISSGKSSRFKYAVANCQGWRSTQEDAHLIICNFEENTSLFAVFDGHNGPEVAKFAAKYFPKHLTRNMNYRQGNIQRGLQEAFMALDELLLTKEGNDVLLHFREKSAYKSTKPIEINETSHPLSYFTGSTAVLLLIKNDIYYCANVGDSRCIICRDRKPKQLSKDHNPDLIEERERIEKAGGIVVNGRINKAINVSRSLGDHWYKRNLKLNQKQQMIIAWPHINVEKIQQEDEFFVLICDGIWNSINNQDLIEFISKRIDHDDLSNVCHDVIKRILSPTPSTDQIVGKDNMTIMIVKRFSFDSNNKFDPSTSNVRISSSIIQSHCSHRNNLNCRKFKN
ncbi:thioredoxin-like protein 1 [Sarcoptes scabiei]|nr:thioredoxin-like protein 1 [Sarcoptes scabiei]